MAFLGFYFGLTIFLLFSSPVTFPHYSRNKECALAHSRACGGRLRHLPYTPQCASSRSVFYFTGKQFPVKQKKFLLFLLIAHRNKRNFFISSSKLFSLEKKFSIKYYLTPAPVSFFHCNASSGCVK